ncbi:MAG: hypothetical protein ACFUZC_16030 [Chthoniobacteraceae bacterium]
MHLFNQLVYWASKVSDADLKDSFSGREKGPRIYLSTAQKKLQEDPDDEDSKRVIAFFEFVDAEQPLTFDHVSEEELIFYRDVDTKLREQGIVLAGWSDLSEN